VFEELAGLPLHPLAVHGAVVLVPLQVLASLAYALVPRLRLRVGWVAVLLAVVAPLAAVLAKLSGEALQQALGLPLQGDLADHRSRGTYTMWLAIALGALTLALVGLHRAGAGSPLRSWLARGVAVLVVLAAGAAAGYVILTGDLGSRMVWEPRWQQVTGG
jgi:uncharacterized membrane protein